MRSVCLLLAFYLLLGVKFIYSQIGIGFQPAQSVQSLKPFQLPFNELMYALEKKNEAYINNMEYAKALSNWIIDLKYSVDSKDFQQYLQTKYEQLIYLLSTDLSTKLNVLTQIEIEVKNKLADYTKYSEDFTEARNAWDKAIFFYNSDQFDSAIVYLNAVHIKVPDFEEAKYYLALVNYKLGLYDKAKTELNRLLSSEKIRFEAYELKGYIHIEEKDYHSAFGVANVMVQIAPQQERAYYFRGLTSMYLGMHSQARSDFVQSLSLNEEYAYSFNQLAIINFKESDLESAISYANKAVSIEPEESNFRIVRGLILYSLQMYDKAYSDCVIALHLDSDNINAYKYKGLSAIGMGEFDEGCELLYKAYEMGAEDLVDQISLFCE